MFFVFYLCRAKLVSLFVVKESRATKVMKKFVIFSKKQTLILFLDKCIHVNVNNSIGIDEMKVIVIFIF